MPRSSPLRFFVSVAFVTVLSAVTGCGIVKEPAIGDKTSGPFAIAGQPGTRNVFVLNSSYAGEYATGSIARYQLNEAGTALSRAGAVEVPRLGNDLAISPDGTILAAAFNSQGSRFKFYKLDPAGGLSALPFEWPTSNGIASQAQFFSPKSAKPGESFLSFVEEPATATSRVVVLKITTSGVSRVLTLPQDLPDSAPEDYAFGYIAPAYDRATGLLIAFPNGATGSNPTLPEPLDFVRDPTGVKTVKWRTAETDLRYVSVVAVDFDGLLKKRNLAAQSAFMPLLYNNDAANADLKADAKAAPNDTFGFRASFSSAIALNQTGCVDEITAAGGALSDTKLAPDSILAADDGTEEVLVFSGLAALKSELAQLPVPKDAKKHRNRQFTSVLKRALYSRKSGVSGLSDVDSRIARLRVVRRGNDCVPVWLRTERGRNSQGNEISRLQTGLGREPIDPLASDVVPVRGSTSFGLLALGTGATTRAFVFTASYSYGDVVPFEYKRGGAKEVIYVPNPDPKKSSKPVKTKTPVAVDHFIPLN